MNSNCSDLLDMRNLQEQVKKVVCYHKLFWSFTVWINCSSDPKILQILGLQPRISKVFQSLQQFFLTVGQNNFGSKIPFLANGLAHRIRKKCQWTCLPELRTRCSWNKNQHSNYYVIDQGMNYLDRTPVWDRCFFIDESCIEKWT